MEEKSTPLPKIDESNKRLKKNNGNKTRTIMGLFAIIGLGIFAYIFFLKGAGDNEKVEDFSEQSSKEPLIEDFQQKDVERIHESMVAPDDVHSDEELFIEFSDRVNDKVDTYYEMMEPISEVVGQFLCFYENGILNQLSSVVSSDSDFYKSHYKYMEHLNEKNIDVNVESFEIKQIDQIGEGQYAAVVEEHYYIIYPDKEPAIIKQKSQYNLVEKGSTVYLTNLTPLK